MVCCCMPCLHKLQVRYDSIPGSGPFTLCLSETIRWICIIVPIYLSVWRYMEIMEKPHDAAFWGMVTGVMLAVSLLVYLPIKLVALRYRVKHNRMRDHRWRPSIVTYLIFCAMPCLVMILYALETSMPEHCFARNCTIGQQTTTASTINDCVTIDCTLDQHTTTVLQITVLGLTLTEWMSKIREEMITYELITAMALDFFFAYDCIQLIMMCFYDPNIYTSEWLYVCFVFAFIAMFRYIPNQPVGVQDKGSSFGAAVCIIVSLVTVDLPFVIIRVWTMVDFGLVVSEIIYPLKNIAMICFGCTQLYLIFNTRKAIKRAKKINHMDMHMSIKRVSRVEGAWDLERGDECIDCACNHQSQVAVQGHENEGADVRNSKVEQVENISDIPEEDYEN